jgi:hypothetical protein
MHFNIVIFFNLQKSLISQVLFNIFWKNFLEDIFISFLTTPESFKMGLDHENIDKMGLICRNLTSIIYDRYPGTSLHI